MNICTDLSCGLETGEVNSIQSIQRKILFYYNFLLIMFIVFAIASISYNDKDS